MVSRTWLRAAHRRNSDSGFDFLERNYDIIELIDMSWIHISDHELERYYPGMVTADVELALLEEHVLACPSCAGRADGVQDYVEAVRVAVLRVSD